MKVLYFDCFSGISGDMTLGALVDLGVPPSYLIENLKSLSISDEFKLKFVKTLKMGISGTKAHVELISNIIEDGDHHHHSHDHRNLADIKGIIEESLLSERTKQWSVSMFEIIAKAEAKIHGTTINDIHFHEVGAVDSIVDIVGCALCFDYFDVEKIISSKIEVGGGFVECAHGTFPVPAPATLEILRGIPCTYGRVQSETTTPTGAAILAVMAHEFRSSGDLQVQKIAYGLGSKDFTIPNVLRVMLCHSEETGEGTFLEESNILIETNIDDMNPEDYENVMDLLFEKGALDVYLTPIIMKKSRPANKISVLTKHHNREEILNLLFLHTTTFGLRIYDAQKIMIKREIKKVKTSMGELSIKKGTFGSSSKWKMEYEELKTLAREHSMTLDSVRSKILKEIEANGFTEI